MPWLAPVTIATRSLRPRFKRSSRQPHRHARACRGHPRLATMAESKTWMAGTSPAMTSPSPRVFQDVHAVAGAIDEIKPAVLVGSDVVRLHRLRALADLRHEAAD